MLGVAELIDVTLWHGWEITHQPGDWSLGPLIAFGRQAVLSAKAGRLTLQLDGNDVLQSTVPGRLRQIVIAANRFSCRLPDLLPDGTEIVLPQVPSISVTSARYAATDLAPQASLANSGSLFKLPATAAGAEFTVTW